MDDRKHPIASPSTPDFRPEPNFRQSDWDTDGYQNRTSAAELAMQVFALLLAVPLAIWVTVNEPLLGPFEQSLRALGIVGTPVGLLWFTHTAAVAFFVLVVIVTLVALVGGLAQRAAESPPQ